MKSLPNQFTRLSSEEWDFRAITDAQLPYSIIYEYARSCPQVINVFEDWHKKELAFDKQDKELCAWNGVSFKEVLGKLIGSQSGSVPPRVSELVFAGLDDSIPHLDILCSLNPLFPVPFLKSGNIDLKISMLEQLKPLVPKTPGFSQLEKTQVFFKDSPHSNFSYPWDSNAFVARQNKLGIRKYEIILDLRRTKNQIKEEFDDWIDNLDDSGIEKFPIKKGKAASQPRFKLKELSAFRLSEAGYFYTQAYKMLAIIAPKRGEEHGHKILPIYESQGAWSDAVNDARERIKQLFS